MSYRISKKKLDGVWVYVISDSDGEEISEWEDLEEARAELHDLNDYAEDVVDFMARSTPGTGAEEDGAESH